MKKICSTKEYVRSQMNILHLKQVTLKIKLPYISNDIKEFITSLNEQVSIKRECNKIIPIIASLKAIKAE